MTVPQLLKRYKELLAIGHQNRTMKQQEELDGIGELLVQRANQGYFNFGNLQSSSYDFNGCEANVLDALKEFKASGLGEIMSIKMRIYYRREVQNGKD